MKDSNEISASEQEAIALARCYRLLIEKAAEYKRKKSPAGDDGIGRKDTQGAENGRHQ